MLVKIAVFDLDQRAHQARWHIGKTHEDAVLAVRGMQGADLHRVEARERSAGIAVPGHLHGGDAITIETHPDTPSGLLAIPETKRPEIQLVGIVRTAPCPRPVERLAARPGQAFDLLLQPGGRNGRPGMQLQRSRVHPRRNAPALALESLDDQSIQTPHMDPERHDEENPDAPGDA